MKKTIFLSLYFFLISCVTTQTTIIENGKEGKGHLKNNLKEGNWFLSKDGKLNSTGKFSKNEKKGTWKFFYPDGKLHQKGKFKNDKQNGIWKYYFDTGEFMGKGKLENDKQIGLWKWYYKNGNLYTERFYEDGKLMEIKSCFDENKNLLDCGEIKNGNGYLLGHDLNNQTDKIEKSEYKNGIFIKNNR